MFYLVENERKIRLYRATYPKSIDGSDYKVYVKVIKPSDPQKLVGESVLLVNSENGRIVMSEKTHVLFKEKVSFCSSRYVKIENGGQIVKNIYHKPYF